MGHSLISEANPLDIPCCPQAMIHFRPSANSAIPDQSRTACVCMPIYTRWRSYLNERFCLIYTDV